METIRDLYHQLAPADVILQNLCLVTNWPAVQAQEEFVACVLRSHKHRPSIKYEKYALKLLLNDIERSHREDGLVDSLAEYVVEVNCCGEQSEDESFCTYRLPNDRFCSLRTLRAHNQVGMKVWEAGLFLAELCLAARSELLTDKVVVELGAGVGISLLLADQGVEEAEKPRKVILTEGPEDVLENLKYNVELNCGPNCDRVETRRLDWTRADSQECEEMHAEVVLAADCTYSEDISESLVSTFEKLLCVGDRRGIGLVVCTVRTAETFQHFLQVLLHSVHLSYEDVTEWAHKEVAVQRFYYLNKESIRVYKLRPSA